MGRLLRTVTTSSGIYELGPCPPGCVSYNVLRDYLRCRGRDMARIAAMAGVTFHLSHYSGGKPVYHYLSRDEVKKLIRAFRARSGRYLLRQATIAEERRLYGKVRYPDYHKGGKSVAPGCPNGGGEPYKGSGF